MKRVREFFEKLVFAGMKPGGTKPVPPPTPEGSLRWLGPLRDPLNRFLSGGATNDPLYLSNRPTSRKLLVWAAIGIPFAGLTVLMFLAASGAFTPAQAPKEPLTAAAIATTLLPNYKDVEIKTARDLEVLEANLNFRVKPLMLKGSAKNVSNRPIQEAEIVFELTDSTGSQLGGISAVLQKIAPDGTAKFEIAIPNPRATFAIVREVHTR
jgi:hypothetical protein